MPLRRQKFINISYNAAEPIRDIKYILEILDLLKDNPRDQAMFMVAISTNLRGSDLVSLTVQHAEDVISKGYCDVIEKKTKKARRVFMNKSAKLILAKLVNERRRKPDVTPKSPLFVGQRGQFTRYTFSRLVQKWCAAVGVPGTISGHSLRKTYGYFQFKVKNVDLESLMHDFNHSDVKTTLYYIGVTDKTEQQKRFEELDYTEL